MGDAGGPGEVGGGGAEVDGGAHEVEEEGGVDGEGELQARQHCNEARGRRRRRRRALMRFNLRRLPSHVIAQHPFQIIPTLHVS